MTGVPVHCYVYYRVRSTHVVAARQAVARLLSTLEQRTGVSGRLLRRQGEPLLWMEIYEGVRDAQAFERELAKLVAQANFSALLAPGSERKTERFVAAP